MTPTPHVTDKSDDTLLLGWRSGPVSGALSVSSAKTLLEDPMKWFLQKVEGRKEPLSLPLVRGSATHAAFEEVLAGRSVPVGIEAFGKSLARAWDRMEDPSRKVNPKDPSQPAGKERERVSFDTVLHDSEDLLEWTLRLFREGWDTYSVTQLLRFQEQHGGGHCERPVGTIAKERGMPYTEAEVYSYSHRDWITTEVGLVGGVPLQGFVDYDGPWHDGSPFILDHKAVSNVVPYWGWHRKPFEPSYDAASDLQLDAYAAATGIVRCGFNFVLKLPQHLPDAGLWPTWVDERKWKGMPVPEVDYQPALPMAWALAGDDTLRWVSVWRPAPEDHPSRPQHFRHENVYPLAAAKLRRAAEFVTEGLLLYTSGTAPEVAFPPGDPKDIGRKACPTCAFNLGGPSDDGCRLPMELPKKNREAVALTHLKRRQVLLDERERACTEHPGIRERRQIWAQNPHSLPRP